jgi:GH35 family endo-1,4-beta-xylanase
MYNRYDVLKKFEASSEFYNNVVYPNIEKYRKGDIKIAIKDKNGRNLEGAKVKITQISHEFKFGANLFMLEELETDEKNSIYKDSFKKIFNIATLPFYWNSIEPEKGKTRYHKDAEKYYRRPSIDLCMEYCEENGIEPREHALAYENHFPEWLYNASVDEIKSAYEHRCSEISKRYASRIPTIEVTNEMLWWEGKTAFYNEPDYIEWCFKTAERYFPNNKLSINEATEECFCDVPRSTARYYAYIEANMLKGARIDAIGTQFHMFYERNGELDKSRSLYNPKNLYDRFDLYSNLTNEIQITEITIPAYSNNKDDEEIQAKIIEYLYTLWFSHHKIKQIIYWNLVDGYAYVPNPTPEKIRMSQGDMTLGENRFYGGLLRFDLSRKPAYDTLDYLINKKWKTDLDFDNTGSVEFRGFYGDYEIQIKTDNGIVTKKFTLSSECENDITLVI